MVIIVMAWRNIWRNKARSLIIMFSVALGLVAGLFVLSLYKGILSARIDTVIGEEVGHLQLHDPSFKEDFDSRFVVSDAANISSALEGNPAVSAFALRSISQGMIATSTGSSGIQIMGVDPDKENAVSRLDTKIIAGDGFSSKRNLVIIGKKLADKMHLNVNSKAILTFADSGSNIISAAFRVAAIYQTNNTPRDETIVFVRRNDLNHLLSLGNDYHEVAVILREDASVARVKQELTGDFAKLKVESWEELSPETRLMIDTTDQYSYIFIAIIMLALSFGIINSMLMAVLERSREIGMLLALGMNRLRIFAMILTETIFLTLSGAPLGICVSWLIVVFYNKHGIDISGLGDQAMTSFGFSNIIFPQFPWEKMINEMLIVTGAAFLASLIPALKAIRLRPVEALQK